MSSIVQWDTCLSLLLNPHAGGSILEAAAQQNLRLRHPSSEAYPEGARSALDTPASGGLEIDPDTKALLTVLNFDLIPISVVVPITTQPERSGPGGGPRQEKRIFLGTAPR
ncbi:hypothetical protein B0H13DRAFT_2311592 [Mycena leptocephala]|nr:hypothetical protein B0H13DRAFT_2311592 [Mycena leptocephala]